LRFLDLDLTGGGLMSGARLRRTLDKELEGVMIEDLTETFVAVATEIGTGREIWLTKGPLVNAIRASYALPGIFRPVQINGRWLMDGAFVNPVPVAVCRAMGANLVIAVNLHHLGISRTGLTPLQASAMELKPAEVIPEPPPKKMRIPILRNWRHQLFSKGNGDGAPGISRVLLEAFNVTQDRIARARLAGDPPDVIITPRLGAMGLFDFHKSKMAIAEGYEATMRQLDEIAQASASLRG
jgi:NTE family protein